MDYTITLNDAEVKALEHVVLDAQEWIQNAAKNRARISIDEIVAAEVERITSEGGEIKGTKEDIVLAANIKSAKQINDKIGARSFQS
jgi:hypothetical protein